jgi:hypothetical protein
MKKTYLLCLFLAVFATAPAAQNLRSFGSKGIRSISFRIGTGGCFVNHYDELTYERNGAVLVSTGIRNKGNKHTGKLSDDIAELDTAMVQEFLQQLASAQSQSVTIADLGFTEKDYRQCKKDILHYAADIKAHKTPAFTSYYPEANTDTLLALADSIRFINSDRLNTALSNNLFEVIVSGGSYAAITIVSEEGQQLQISTKYRVPETEFAMWTISRDSVLFKSLSPCINHFLKVACPDLLMEPHKMPMLYHLVNVLYRTPAF